VVRLGGALAGAAFVLSCWAIGQFLWCALARGESAERLTVVSARRALHSFAIISLLLTALAPDKGFMAIGAALLVGVLYLLMRLRWGRSIFEDAAAIALVEALFVYGAKIGVANAEYYLSAIGFYLCFTMWRSYMKAMSAPPSTRSVPHPRGRLRRLLRFTSDNPAAVTVVAIASVYPFWKYIRTLDNAHLYYLGSGAVVLIYLFLWTRLNAALVYVVGALFVSAAGVFLVFGHVTNGINLFLVLVGASIIVSQLYPGSAGKVGVQPAPKAIKPGMAAVAAGD
jgi:hypothetical protein